MMRGLVVALFAALVLMLTACGAEENTTQPTKTGVDVSEQVKLEFLFAWENYKEHAWGHDELLPLSGGFRDWHAKSLLITPIDSVDTMYIMGFEEEAEKTIAYITENLDFDLDAPVKHFEIVIRVLGGLISIYQFSDDQAVLELAVDLADRMLPVFDSPTGMPYMYVNLATGEVSGEEVNPAEIGTIQLEYGVLSRLTGNPVYWEKARKAAVELFSRRSALDLVGANIDVETGEWTSTVSHVNGLIDSWYEYLYKSAVLFDDQEFMKMYEISMAAVLEHLLEVRGGEAWFKQVDMNTGEITTTHWTALSAFMAGLLATSEHINVARSSQRANFNIWQIHEIEPEAMDFNSRVLVNPAYYLRPEIMESAWYLYRETGQEKYFDMNFEIFHNLRVHCKAEFGYAELADVRTKEQRDRMESFFLAETLKYLYLTFDDAASKRVEEAVFNTEAHPFFKTW